MNIIIVIILVIIISTFGIIILQGKSPFTKKTRGQFLKELAEFMEGSLQPLPGKEQGFSVSYQLEGVNVIFEDFLDQGFDRKGRKALLKVKTNNPLILGFMEKEGKATSRSAPFMPSQISDEPIEKIIKVKIPDQLKFFRILTNDPLQTNFLFEDPRVLDIFLAYKNLDNRGYPYMSLKIWEGEIILEFQPTAACHPGLPDLQQDIPTIENHTEKLLVLYRLLEELNDLKKK